MGELRRSIGEEGGTLLKEERTNELGIEKEEETS